MQAEPVTLFGVASTGPLQAWTPRICFWFLCTIAVEHPAFTDLFRYFPEVKPVDGIGYGQRKEPRCSDERPEEKLPEIEPLFADHPQEQDRLEQRPHIPGLD